MDAVIEHQIMQRPASSTEHRKQQLEMLQTSADQNQMMTENIIPDDSQPVALALLLRNNPIT